MTSIQNFDQLGVVLGKKKAKILVIRNIIFVIKFTILEIKKENYFFFYFRVDEFHVNDIN